MEVYIRNLNTYIPVKEFYNSRREPITSLADLKARKKDSWTNCTNASSFTLEISGATTMKCKLKGCININDVNEKRVYHPIQMIDLSNYSLVDEITKDGLYMIAITGIQEIMPEITEVSGVAIIVGAWRLERRLMNDIIARALAIKAQNVLNTKADLVDGKIPLGQLPDSFDGTVFSKYLRVGNETAGNLHIIKFATVNYTTYATCFKMSAMTCHDNGTSYKFLVDILIAVTTAGCKLWRL